MALGRYRLQHLLRVTDYVSIYDAFAAEDNAACEVCILERNRFDSRTWAIFAKRLRLVAMMQHPSSIRIRDFDLDQSAPYFARDPSDEFTLFAQFESASPLPPRQSAAVVRQLADVLSAAHRMGVVHGTLTPRSIAVSPTGTIRIDLAGLELLDQSGQTSPDPGSDILDLGRVLCWLMTGREEPGELAEISAERLATQPSLAGNTGDLAILAVLQTLARECLAADPADRPTAGDIVDRIDETLSPGSTPPTLEVTLLEAGMPIAPVAHEPTEMPESLGRFRLSEKLGQGGMGTVYRAEDLGDGSVVAIKVLNPELSRNPAALKRFQKEARMMSAVRNPHTANLVEVNEQNGIHYLAMEYVAGRSLRALIDERKRLNEIDGLAIVADVCRALADAHRQGIIHRDIKPENILLIDDPPGFRVKLTDFGLARQVEQSVSLNLTQDKLIGTPLYMAPEQGQAGSAIDARTDVYALGATLFHILAGRPPFLAETTFAVLMLHANEPPPTLRNFAPDASDGVIRIIERAMAKRANERFIDAAAMLQEIERLRRGEPSLIAVHPIQPKSPPGSIREFVFRWNMEANPEELWPHVSNTERLNRAIGLPSVRFASRQDGGRVRRFGRAKKIGLVAEWEEHPFEWVEGRRFGVLREMSRGPFEWITSVVELAPKTGGGTALTHTFRMVPRGLIGRLVAAVEIGINTRKSLERVYRRIDSVAVNEPSPLVDHFENVRGTSGDRQRKLDAGIGRLAARGVPPAIAEAIGDYLSSAPDQAVARIRPLAVATQFGLDPIPFVDACLLAADEGLLVLMWDILCPVCRIPAQIHDSLKTIREHDRCEACNLDFQLDFANSVEMIFRVHPEIRASELGVFCIGGPAHSPHVAAQVRIAAGESLELNLSLGEGSYRFRGPQLPYAVDFRVANGAKAERWDFPLSRRPGNDLPLAIQDGGQTFALTNDTETEMLVRIERIAPGTDALTAARAATLPLFRELFPDQRLTPGQLVTVSQVTLLVTQLDHVGQWYRELGDAKAFATIHEHFRLLEEIVKRDGGAVVKTIHAGMMAAFSEPAAAVRAALDMPDALAKSEATRDLSLRAGVHRGSALTATINDRLDYFGITANLAAELPLLGQPGDLILSRAVGSDAAVVELLKARKVYLEILPITDHEDSFVHRIVQVSRTDRNEK